MFRGRFLFNLFCKGVLKMEAFLELVKANGVEGLFLGFAVLLIVFGLNKSGVVISGEHKRFANIVLSLLLAGVSLLDPSQGDVVQAAIASLGSAVAYELIRWVLSFKPSGG